MNLVTFQQKGQDPSQQTIGICKDDSVVSLKEGFKWIQDQGLAPSHISSEVTENMVRFIEHSESGLPAARRLEASWADLPKNLTYPLSEVQLLSPIPRPTSLRDGYAFRQHVETARRNRGVPMIPEFDEFPVFYFSNHLAVSGPGELKVQTRAMERLDFELEVGIVIGKECRNVKADKADEYIFGYMVMNDWSARALQMQEMKLNLGPAKGKDFSTTLGPYLVPREDLAQFSSRDEKGERLDLSMKAWVNDKQLSEGNLKDMTWTFAQIIERASYGVTLHPGEVIGSGTVGTGCLLELNGSKITDNLWIKNGDTVALEVDGLGRLENTIKEENI